MLGIVPTRVEFPDEVNVLEAEFPWCGKVLPFNVVHHLLAFPHQRVHDGMDHDKLR